MTLGAQGREQRIEQRSGAREWTTKMEQRRDCGLEQVRQGGGTLKEGGEVLALPPIMVTLDQWRVPPPFFHPEQLELVFDLRR